MRINIDEFIEKLPNIRYSERLDLLRLLKEDNSIPVFEKKKLYDKLSSDVAYWAKVFMGHIVDHVPTFHIEIYNGMQGLLTDPDQDFFAAIVFREAAKSTIKNIFSMHCACHQSQPLILMISEVEDQAVADLRSVTDEFESNELIKYFYFNIRPEDKKTTPKGTIWNAGYIELSNGVAIVAKGMNSAMRGFKHKNQRPTLVIMDDFESKKSLATEEMRTMNADTVDNVIIPIIAKNGKFIFLNTIVSPDAYMQKQYKLYGEGRGLFASPQGKLVKKELTYWKDNVEYPTWPEYKDWTWIKKKKQIYIDNNNISGWLQEYYNIPKEESDPKFNTSFITPIKGSFHAYKYVKFIEANGKKIPINTFIGLDPAVRLGEGNDDTAIIVIGMDKNSNIYILDIFAGKIEEIKKPNLFIGMCRKYKIDIGVVETYGYQFSLLEWIKKFCRDNNDFYSLQEFSNGISKKQKYLEGIETPINSGKVCYLEGCENVKLLISQLEKISSGKRTHDDLADALYLSMLKAFPNLMDEATCNKYLDKEKMEVNVKEKKYDSTNWRVA